VQSPQELLKFLVKSPLDFVIIGGFAAVLHGCEQTTRDIDICLVLNEDQVRLLNEVLAPLHPKYRTTSEKTPFQIADIKDFTQDLHLETDFGILDIVSHVKGVGDFYDVLKNADEFELYGGKCHLISIDDLIKSKKVLGRHRDLTVIEELEAIKQEKTDNY
jgi:hypothetical protein